MLTSKERSALRGQATTLDTTLMVGKEGVSQTLIEEADRQLTARELIKGKVLENAMMTPREVCDALCEATGAEGVAVIGTKFVIYRKSKKLEAQRAIAAAKERAAKQVNPVRAGIQRRKAAARKERERKDEYFRQQREKERRNKT